MTDALFRVRRLLSLSGDDRVQLACSAVSENTVHVVLITERCRLLLLRWSVGYCRPLHIQQHQLPLDKKVTAVCLQPCTAALLLIAVDAGALYIIPTGVGDVDSPAPMIWADSQWSGFSAVAWWTRFDGRHFAVVGCRSGHVHVVDVFTAALVGSTCVSVGVDRLYVVKSPPAQSGDAAELGEGVVCWLIILTDDKQQWRVLLENTASGHVFPLGERAVPCSYRDTPSTIESTADLFRSRLTNLKQFSRDKLGVLQQRWSAVRQSSLIPQQQQLQKQKQQLQSGCKCQTAAASCPAGRPENVSGMVGDVIVSAHYLTANQHVLVGYYKPLCSLSVYSGGDLHLPPSSVHQLHAIASSVAADAFSSHLVHFTDTAVFVGRPDCGKLTVLSTQLTRCDKVSATTTASTVLADLSVCDAEDTLLHVFPSCSLVPQRSSDDTPDWLDLHHSPVCCCLLVTRTSVSVCEALSSPESLCVQAVLTSEADVTPQLARLHTIFQHSDQQRARILEIVGDVRLRQRHFSQALSCYRLLKLSPVQVMCKLAAHGFTAQLLHYVGVISRTMRLGDDPCLLANVSLLSLAQIALRSNCNGSLGTDRLQLVRFLRSNRRYSVSLAMRVCLFSRLSECVSVLIENHGAHHLLLTACKQTSLSCDEDDDDDIESLWSVPMQLLLSRGMKSALLDHREYGARLLNWFLQRVDSMSRDQLLKLVEVTDPMAVELRSFTHCFLAPQSPRQSACSVHDSCLQLDKLVMLHLNALLRCIVKCDTAASSAEYSDVTVPVDRMFSNESTRYTCTAHSVTSATSVDERPFYVSVSASETHVAAVSASGDLCIWHVETPRVTVPICAAFDESRLNSTSSRKVGVLVCVAGGAVRVHQASCGRQHTLLLTSAGVYVMGSSSHGQLGLGRSVCGSQRPQVIRALANSRTRRCVVGVAAGHHHSTAVDSDGRLFTWGWNVFGQCGHGHVEDVHVPRLVRALRHVRIVQAAAGYAHTAALTSDGAVYVFGCNSYGQLGNGSVEKSSVPLPLYQTFSAVSVSRVVCGPFTCLLTLDDCRQDSADAQSGRVMRLGCDPQTVRCNSQQARRRLARLIASGGQQSIDSSHTPPSPQKPGTVTPEYRRHLRPMHVNGIPAGPRLLAAGTRHVACVVGDRELIVVATGLEPLSTIDSCSATATNTADGSADSDHVQCVPVPAECGRIEHLVCGADTLLVLTHTGSIYMWRVQRLGRVELEYQSLLSPDSSSHDNCDNVGELFDEMSDHARQCPIIRPDNLCFNTADVSVSSLVHRLNTVATIFIRHISTENLQLLLESCCHHRLWWLAARISALSHDWCSALNYYLRYLTDRNTHMGDAAVCVDKSTKSQTFPATANNVHCTSNNCEDIVTMNGIDATGGSPNTTSTHTEIPAAAIAAASYCLSVCGQQCGDVERVLSLMLRTWHQHQLPSHQLETMLRKHWSCVLPALAWLVWRVDITANAASRDTVQQTRDGEEGEVDGDSLLAPLSAQFCAVLCSAVCCEIERSPSLAVRSLTGAECLSADSLLFRLLQRRHDMVMVLPSRQDAAQQSHRQSLPDVAGECVAFSCGHSYSLTNYRRDILPQVTEALGKLYLPHTAKILLQSFSCDQLSSCSCRSCPPCALQYISSCVKQAKSIDGSDQDSVTETFTPE